MAGQTYLVRSIIKHAGMLAGMLSVTCLAVPLFDRLMYCCLGNGLMTGQTKSSFRREHVDGAAVQPMTFIALTVPYR
jgi:hypothetical protein